MKGRDPIEEYPRAVSFYPRNKNPPFQIQPSRKKVSREIISETLHGSKSFPAICGRICGFYECQKFPRLSPKDAFAGKKDGNSGLENRIGSVSRSWDWAGVKSWKDRIQSACKSSNAAECGAICLSLSLSLSFPSSSFFYFVVSFSLFLCLVPVLSQIPRQTRNLDGLRTLRRDFTVQQGARGLRISAWKLRKSDEFLSSKFPRIGLSFHPAHFGLGINFFSFLDVFHEVHRKQRNDIRFSSIRLSKLEDES